MARTHTEPHQPRHTPQPKHHKSDAPSQQRTIPTRPSQTTLRHRHTTTHRMGTNHLSTPHGRHHERSTPTATGSESTRNRHRLRLACIHNSRSNSPHRQPKRKLGTHTHHRNHKRTSRLRHRKHKQNRLRRPHHNHQHRRLTRPSTRSPVRPHHSHSSRTEHTATAHRPTKTQRPPSHTSRNHTILPDPHPSRQKRPQTHKRRPRRSSLRTTNRKIRTAITRATIDVTHNDIHRHNIYKHQR